MMRMPINLTLAAAAAAHAPQQAPENASIGAPPAHAVRVMRVPEGGVQPEVVVDGDGAVHLVYFSGEARAGNLMYMKSTDGGAKFSEPVRVNSIDNSALAVGSVRGSQLALGRDGRVHVVWNASNAVRMKDPANPDAHNTPLLYARLKDDRSGFEPERNVITTHFGLDGGAAIAADGEGRVHVVWHAPAQPGQQGEDNRRVWTVSSIDDGATFGPERAIDSQQRGCCACCGVAAFCSPAGDVHVLYRSAEQVVHRDMHLLVSRDAGSTFTQRPIDQWEVGQCVMSTAALASLPTSQGPAAVRAAWETRGAVYTSILPAAGDDASRTLAPTKPAGQGDNAKHPALAINSRGETLLAWTENTAFGKGGSVAWQIFDRDGKPMLERPGRSDKLPVWGLVAVFATPHGGFVVVY